MSNLVTKLSLAALLAGASSTALAAPGDGIRLGGSEGRLHPFIELEGRRDSKAYIDPAGGQDFADTIIHVRPGLTLAVPGEMTAVELSAKLDVVQYMGSDDPVTKDLNRVYAEAELGVTVNRQGAVGFELDDTFRRSNRPQALSISTGVVSNYNLLDVRVPWRPGGGALTLHANGGWALETYEALVTGASCPGPDPICALADLGYNELRAGAGAAWKFLPRTSALLEAGYFKRIPKDSAKPDPAGYRVSTGLTGLVTPHIAATLKAGYGSTTAVGAVPALRTWLAAAECEWLPSETTSVKLGYGHDLAVDPTTLYTVDRLSLGARQLVASRFALALTGSWELLDYASSPETTTIVRVSPSVGVEVTRWLRTELAYAYTDRSASSGLALSVGAAEYSKSEAWLKVVATY